MRIGQISLEYARHRTWTGLDWIQAAFLQTAPLWVLAPDEGNSTYGLIA